ncbi:hypothetical protein [Alicyclobacillus sp.]|uniref:hypothetical protein n=1 Tax=Alicyclobacillus sp. TaxID=61169 RepID=UPI0025C61B8F|nr:hypothetical protein [Alicyclobacillus sp.]MCL6515899.1 hypothetical protein [Alicyclobacillus sp.]
MPHRGVQFPFGQVMAPNPPVREVSSVASPHVHPTTAIGKGATLVGDITVDEGVFIGYYAVLRADSAYPFYIGPKTNLQDYVLLHCHPAQFVTVRGKRMGVFIEGEVSVLHHAAVHGPLFIGRNTFIGQHASVYDAVIGRNCVIMHGAVVTHRVQIPDGRYVAPGQAVHTQDQADALPPVPEEFRHLNAEIVDHYHRLGRSYIQHSPLFIGRSTPNQTLHTPEHPPAPNT